MPARFFKSRLKNWLGVKSSPPEWSVFQAPACCAASVPASDMQQLFADIANVANTFAQITLAEAESLAQTCSILLMIAAPAPDAVLSSGDGYCLQIHHPNQRQMGAEDSFAFAVTLTQCWFSCSASVARLCSSRVESCHWRGLPDNCRGCRFVTGSAYHADAACQHIAVQ